MNRLDINTPRGRRAAQDQARALDIVATTTGLVFAATDDTERAIVDAVAIKAGRIVAVVEVKSREMTAQTLRGAFGNRWLVTLDKIITAAQVAEALRVPLIGLLYLVPDNLVLSIRLSGKDGQLVCDYSVQKTATQATCNGGTAIRQNAFINMAAARQYQGRAAEARAAPKAERLPLQLGFPALPPIRRAS